MRAVYTFVPDTRYLEEDPRHPDVIRFVPDEIVYLYEGQRFVWVNPDYVEPEGPCV